MRPTTGGLTWTIASWPFVKVSDVVLWASAFVHAFEACIGDQRSVPGARYSESLVVENRTDSVKVNDLDWVGSCDACFVGVPNRAGATMLSWKCEECGLVPVDDFVWWYAEKHGQMKTCCLRRTICIARRQLKALPKG